MGLLLRGSDTPSEVIWNIPTLIKGINHQFNLNLPDEVAEDDEYASNYFVTLEEEWKKI